MGFRLIFDRVRSVFKASASKRGVVLRDNWGSVITGDIKGDVVIVNGERHSFSLHIARVSDPVPENVGSLLTWRSRIPKKLYGREAEFADLLRWAAEPAEIRVRIIHGEGGTGKTRMAFEVAKVLREEGWQAGQMSDPTMPVVFPKSDKGILLIIDYPEQFTDALERLLRLIKNSELAGIRLRLLLLSRNGSAMETRVNAQVEHFHSAPMELKPLASERVAWALFRDGWTKMAQLRNHSGELGLDEAAFNAWIKRDSAHTQPLIVLAFALNLLYDPDATQLGRTEVLQKLVARERELLGQEIKSHNLQFEGTLLLKALAAIPGKLTAADINQLQGQLPDPAIKLPPAIEVQRTTLWRDEALHEMQPDLLASVLLHDVIREWLPEPAKVGAWIWAFLKTGEPDGAEFRRRLQRLARLDLDLPRPVMANATPNVLGQTLAYEVRQDEDKADRINAALNEDASALERPLQPAALAAAQKRVELNEQLANGPDLAMSLNNLSIRLGETGDREGGLVAIRRAVEINEPLAKDNFAAYGPALAGSLNNLSILLGETGDRAGGLVAIRRAVEIEEQLAKDNFVAYGPALANHLNTLSNLLGETGDRAGGLVAIRRAVEINEPLAEDNFRAYGPALASSLNTLSIRLSETGDRSGGLVAIRRAVEINEQLAKDNFAAYGPALANSLNNLSNRLGETGDLSGGLVAIRRAVEINEQLAKDNFAAYGPDLAGSLHNLSNRLSETGDRSSGLVAIRRAVEINEQLAKDNFAAYGPALANSLNTLSILLDETGDLSGGLVAIRRAVEINEPLAKDNFAAYGPDLAISLDNLSILLGETGDRADADAAGKMAATIRERLARDKK